MGQESYTVRDMPREERPRERLMKFGAEALSSAELLAVVLGRGVKGEPVTATSQKLLNAFGNLRGVLDASPEELHELKGIGPAKSCQLRAIQEIARRLEDPHYSVVGVVVKGPEQVFDEVKALLKGKKEEHFLTVLLDTRNRIIETFEVSKGSLDTSIVHPREAFIKAVRRSAASMVLVHNHPSGDPEPSEEDIKLTKRLVQTSDIIGIDILDHLVVGGSKYVSMKTRGMM